MRYLPIVFTLVAGIFGLLWGVYKDILSPKLKRWVVLLPCLAIIGVAVAQWQLAKYDEQRTKYQSETGILRSRSKSTKKNPSIQLCGSELLWAGDQDKPAYTVGGDNIYLRMQDGEAKLSMIVRNEHGVVVSTITNNVWFVPKATERVLDKNFTDDTLEVVDSRKKIVLQVQIIGEKVRLAETTYSANGDGPFSFGPFLNECDRLGETLFKYPSSTFPGELNK